ncbi:MAG: substrate-binding domain-containing protein [Spirochaetaceae bacterium]|nr:substrate-binding domain-containing protein [Spirochaetaceae bacterium]
MRKDRSRYRIAFFTSQLEGDYNVRLWKGIHWESQKNNIDLVIYPGHALKAESEEVSSYNGIYDFFDPKKFDGLILSSGTLMDTVGEESYVKFLKKYRNLPMVSIAADLGICSSITIDNFSGMKLMADHLIHYHGYKKFAYLSGTIHNPESVDRLRGFREALAQNNIPLEEENIFYGAFQQQLVKEVLTPLLSRNLSDLDALVCANDDMAMGAIDLLESQGYSIPEDIVVTGFDNSRLNSSYPLSITSIDQPVGEIAKESVQLLLAMIEGKTERKHINKKLDLVIKESCRCFTFPEFKMLFRSRTNIREINLKLIIEEIPKGLFSDSIIIDLFMKDQEKLEELLIKDLESETSEFFFVKKIRDYLYQNNSQFFFINLRKMIMYIQGKLNSIFSDASIVSNLNILNYQFVILFDNYEKRNQTLGRFYTNMWSSSMRESHQELLTSKDLPTLYEVIDKLFHINSINTYYLMLYKSRTLTSELQLKYGRSDGVYIDCKEEDYSFPSENFIPEELLPDKKRTTLVLLPLFSFNRYFGHLAAEVGGLDSSFYEDMQMNISSALMSVLSLRERVEAEEKLQQSLLELKETQGLLIESEKLSALGNLVAGLSHEVNTPLGVLMTAISHLQTITENLYDDFKGNKLSKNDLESYFSSTLSSFNLINKNLDTAINLINRFKMISSNHDMERKREFNLSDHLKKIINSMSGELELNNHTIILDIPKMVILNSFPGVFTQIFLNLISNSMLHGLNDSQSGTIDIHLSCKESEIVIIYKDNGKGCSIEELNLLFNPFYTTLRGTGHSGLGLTIVYNLIRNKLSGRIEGRLGDPDGLIFEIHIPI